MLTRKKLPHPLKSSKMGSFWDPALAAVFHALVNVAAFGLYSVAGLLLLPATFFTAKYPRWLVLLGTAEWGIAAPSTLLLVVAAGVIDKYTTRHHLNLIQLIVTTNSCQPVGEVGS